MLTSHFYLFSIQVSKFEPVKTRSLASSSLEGLLTLYTQPLEALKASKSKLAKIAMIRDRLKNKAMMTGCSHVDQPPLSFFYPSKQV